MRWPEPIIGSDEVHIWWFGLDPPVPVITELERCLSRDERERMQRLVFERHRQRFVVGRGVLRHLLGAYCRADPAHLEFQYTCFGKPSLARPAAQRLEFNLSHSADVAVCAIASGRALGVDVERIRDMPEASDLLRRHATPAERAAYWSLPVARRVDGFCHWWVRKEAYVKAIGRGLAQPLSEFSITLAPDEPVSLLAVDSDPAAVARWSLRQVAAPAGHAACVAVEGSGWRLVERSAATCIPLVPLSSGGDAPPVGVAADVTGRREGLVHPDQSRALATRLPRACNATYLR